MPDRIFIYRDGCGDGQFEGVAQFEIPQIERAFSEVNEKYSPQLTVFIVKKRGNTRFFLKENRQDFGNAKMGTVIDQTIVKEQG